MSICDVYGHNLIVGWCLDCRQHITPLPDPDTLIELDENGDERVVEAGGS